ncbi:MAG TPA: hypothetical protein DCR90_05760 [Fusobacteriaceae bacterium]|nr:hypothetical protein [Fusobacteriaceae bacterium]
MKYILTNKPQKINETKGEIQNVSVRHVIVLAAGTSIPSVDTSTITVRPGESYPFKTVLGEVLYAWIINANDDETLEVSVINFPSEGEGGDTDISAIETEIINQGKQIQNLSKKLPEGTILAVDYRKGVTAQDYEGNLIEPNWIETTIGHDNGVFYNSDGNFQGQRDRTKGLWAGIGTTNELKNDFVGFRGLTLDLLEKKQDGTDVYRLYGVSEFTGAGFVSVDNLSVVLGDKVSMSMKLEATEIFTVRMVGGGVTKTLSKNTDGYYEGTIKATENGTVSLYFYLFDISGGADVDIIVEIKNPTLEKSPIATPFCENNRGGCNVSYPFIKNLATEDYTIISKFNGELVDCFDSGAFYIAQGDNGQFISFFFNNVHEIENPKLITTVSNGITKMFVEGILVRTDVVRITGQSLKDSISFTAKPSTENRYPNSFLESCIFLDRILTDEEISLYTNSDIEIPDVGEYYPIAFSKKRADQYGTTKRGWKVVSTDEDIFEIKGKRYKVIGATGIEETVVIDNDGVKTGTALDQVNGYLRVNTSVVLPCDVEVL